MKTWGKLSGARSGDGAAHIEIILMMSDKIMFTGKMMMIFQVNLEEHSYLRIDSELVMEMTEDLQPGDYVWSLAFTGSLIEDNLGFYMSSYKNSAGETRYITLFTRQHKQGYLA